MVEIRRWGGRLRRAGTRVVSELVGIDTRALAVFRMGIGILLLTDLAVRASDLRIFYSDDGVFPRALLVDRSSPWTISLYLVSGAPAFVALLFAVAAVAAVCLVLGYRTRPAAVLSWLLLTSLQNRNPLVNQNGDLLLHLVLFWALFLPLGARYSLDNRRRPVSAPGRVVSFASFALLAQVVMMYVFTSLLKSGPDWTRNGTAVYYALQYRLLATPRAHFLLQFPGLLTAVTHVTLWFERLGPLLLFIPFVGAPIRTLAVFGFMSFHLGMSTFLALGPFMWVPEVALIPFLPASFWDGLERRLRRSRLGGSIPTARLAARLALVLPALMLFPVPGGRSTTELEPEIAAPATGPKETDHSSAPMAHARTATSGAPVSRRGRLLLSVLPLLLIVYAFLLNMRTVTHGSYVVLPRLQWLGDSLSLDQEWNMFAPRPPHSSGWFVIPGKLADGRTLDFWRGPRPLSWTQPASIEALYPNERWRKYAENLSRFPQLQIDYARYLCRSWNSGHHGGPALNRFKIYFMLLPTPPHASDHIAARRVLEVRWFCVGKPPRTA